MSTHALWTGQDSGGTWWSLRSDSTLWHYSLTAGWTQNTTQTQIDAILWLAVAQAYAAAVAMAGFAVAEGESGLPPPPPPPQV